MIAPKRGAVVIALLVGLLPALMLPTRARAQQFSIGFSDGVFAGPQSATWLHRAAAASANVVLINIGWVAPNTAAKPAGFDALNPASPGYDFTAADAAVKRATADGLRVILQFTGAPAWAEGPHMPADATPGTWDPNDRDIEQYAVALAKRYSGHFSDPSDPRHHLPRVWAFQLWNEPNLPDYLEPQWSRGHAVSPVIYRRMLDAFYTGIKSIDPAALVVTAGTGPFGDPPPTGPRMSPALFWRVALCVRETGAEQLRPGYCKTPARFDVLAHHPYSVGAPSTAALNPDDVSIPDIGKLSAILRVAEHAGTALPRIHHPIWATETGYNTRPPNPKGIPVLEAARWLDQTLELLWSQGVTLVCLNTIVDQPPDPSYFVTSQSGVYYLDGQPKPSLAAFRFPLVVTRKTGEVRVWGRSPGRGEAKIEVLRDSKWRTVSSLPVNKDGIFVTHFVDSGRLAIRAREGTAVSLTWTLDGQSAFAGNTASGRGRTQESNPSRNRSDTPVTRARK